MTTRLSARTAALLLACLCVAGVAAAQSARVSEPVLPSRAHTPWLDVHDGDLIVLAGAGAVAAVCKLCENDAEMAEELDRSSLDGLYDAGNNYGDGKLLGGGALLMMGIGRLTGYRGIADVGDDLARAMVTAWVPVWLLKPAVNARRPNGGKYSFPSGHTATAFAAAPVLAHHGGPVVGFLAYTMAFATGMGRMEANKHHLADVTMGAAIGFVAGETAVRAREAKLGCFDVELTPTKASLSFNF